MSQTHAFADMPKEIAALGEKNIFIATYTNAKTGKEYRRLLVKNEEGKFFDYRMFGDQNNPKNWLTQEQWWRKVGLGENYTCEIKSFDGAAISKISPVANLKYEKVSTQAPKSTGASWLQRSSLEGPVVLALLNEQREIEEKEGKAFTRKFTNVRGQPAQRVAGFLGIFERAHEVIGLVDKYAKMYGVPLEEAMALFAAETMLIANGKSGTGCSGIGQLSTRTAASLKDLNGNYIFTQRRETRVKKTGEKITVLDDIYDVEKNIHASINYYAQMKRRFGSFEKAAMAYNVGPGGDFKSAGARAYALRSADFKRFFEDVQVGNLRSMGVDEFMQSAQYKQGYARLESFRDRGGYLA